ncbi:SPT2-domain-containing protein [Madurella fahalii]|uniref:SPT2-domain-containing protein n=1 Tax=Madurella fahalii TaxID=1157608 RepID=A0ABQ0G0P8_9PEZI
MPILDLLASITGEKPTPSPNPPPRPSATLPKRKAEDELRIAGSKTARTQSMVDSSSGPNGNPSKPSPRPEDKPMGNSIDKAAPTLRPLVNKPGLTQRPGATTTQPIAAGSSSTHSSKPLPSRPVAKRPAPTDSAPPKKRSFAEIMARAKANSEQRESLGKIHHKTIGRPMTMKERKEMKAEESRKSRAASRPAVPGRSGATVTPLRDGGKSSGSRNGLSSGPTSVKKAGPVVEEKKIKKAALATTGYTGTARPPPGTSTTAKAAAISRSSSEPASRDRPRYGAPATSSRRRYEDDDDLDDFIEYDEDEEPGYGNRPGYGYGSEEDESDMEAGLSDIEDEEQEADRFARREDLEQEALERRLKREKEERKRKLLQAARSKAGAR